MYKKFFKRFFDIVLSLGGLLVLWPIMLIVGIAVKCDSKGPMVFATKRMGRNQKPFKFYKFRSMRTDAPKDAHPTQINADEYLTKVGRFIRKTSLDELPQLWCILKGDMSIIGYRPSGFNEPDLVEERERLGVHKQRPGLTGWAQVNGRDVLAKDVPAKAAFDAYYCDNISFKLDMKIFFMTIKQVLVSDGIEEGHAEGYANAQANATATEVAADVVEEDNVVETADVASNDEVIEVAVEIVED